mmetsp:Transcript_23426/g.73813  ORF Transcript_23426/g.73813 Transcript_23426/m.73813 type:complete len:522 (+) Transcript_23426:188-1753(+)
MGATFLSAMSRMGACLEAPFALTWGARASSKDDFCGIACCSHALERPHARCLCTCSCRQRLKKGSCECGSGVMARPGAQVMSGVGDRTAGDPQASGRMGRLSRSWSSPATLRWKAKSGVRAPASMLALSPSNGSAPLQPFGADVAGSPQAPLRADVDAVSGKALALQPSGLSQLQACLPKLSPRQSSPGCCSPGCSVASPAEQRDGAPLAEQRDDDTLDEQREASCLDEGRLCTGSSPRRFSSSSRISSALPPSGAAKAATAAPAVSQQALRKSAGEASPASCSGTPWTPSSRLQTPWKASSSKSATATAAESCCGTSCGSPAKSRSTHSTSSVSSLPAVSAPPCWARIFGTAMVTMAPHRSSWHFCDVCLARMNRAMAVCAFASFFHIGLRNSIRTSRMAASSSSFASSWVRSRTPVSATYSRRAARSTFTVPPSRACCKAASSSSMPLRNWAQSKVTSAALACCCMCSRSLHSVPSMTKSSEIRSALMACRVLFTTQATVSLKVCLVPEEAWNFCRVRL